MIKETIQGDIRRTPFDNIAFHARPNGEQNSGFASTFSKEQWPELYGPSELGMVLSKEIDGKTYHAIIAWPAFNDYTNTDKLYLEGLNSIPNVVSIASILPGAEHLGMQGAQHIRDAINMANKDVWIYHL